ncbi:MAG: DUF1640 domain-containing protein [Deltaproteobacteria bacterium]|nr:DUF1640 domain-containing protein [Deltaproteobacteria bacterium]
MATVDTLKAYEALIGADMPDRQARALLTIVQELQETRLAEVAGKGDLAELKSAVNADSLALREDFAAFKAEVREDIAALKVDLTAFKAEVREDIAALKVDLTVFKTEVKGDIATLRSEMRELEARLEARIDRVKFDLLKWFIPLILGQAAFIVALLRLLH